MSQAGPVNILNGIDLKIAKGEAIGLVGPSGSGKSTMLMVMAGLERPTSGKVTVAGQELSKFDEDAAARFRRGNVGIVFQSFHLIPTMTALENVAVPLELAMVSDAFDRALEGLKAVGLAHRLDHYPSQLSGGEQQRVALARAIAPRPGILFADEPTGNLDGRTGGEIMDLMFALHRERAATLVLVTHDEDLVRRCDRIVRLRDGRIDGIETIEHSATPIIVPAPQSFVVASTLAARPATVPQEVPAYSPPPAIERVPERSEGVSEPSAPPIAAPAPFVEEMMPGIFAGEPVLEEPIALTGPAVVTAPVEEIIPPPPESPPAAPAEIEPEFAAPPPTIDSSPEPESPPDVADDAQRAAPAPREEPVREPTVEASTGGSTGAAPAEELGATYEAAEIESEFRRVAAGGE